MEIELEKKHKIFIRVDIDDLIKEINEEPLEKRWSIISQIFRECKFDNPETIGEGQKFAILQFLEKNYKLYKYGAK